MIRTDILSDKKCVHIKIKKEVHLRLREKLFAYELSIQGIFDEFANMIVNEDRRAMKMLDEFAIKKAKAQLEKPIKNKKIASKERIDELDHNTLYSMINAESPKNRRESDDETA